MNAMLIVDEILLIKFEYRLLNYTRIIWFFITRYNYKIITR